MVENWFYCYFPSFWTSKAHFLKSYYPKHSQLQDALKHRILNRLTLSLDQTTRNWVENHCWAKHLKSVSRDTSQNWKLYVANTVPVTKYYSYLKWSCWQRKIEFQNIRTFLGSACRASHNCFSFFLISFACCTLTSISVIPSVWTSRTFL